MRGTSCADPALVRAAESVLAKAVATVRSASQQHILHAVSKVRRFEDKRPDLPDMQLIREACWREEALSLHYVDRNGEATQCSIWPLGIVYSENALVLLSWCRLRADFRMFRPERIRHVEKLGETFRPRRVSLLREYLARLAV